MLVKGVIRSAEYFTTASQPSTGAHSVMKPHGTGPQLAVEFLERGLTEFSDDGSGSEGELYHAGC